MEFYDFFKKIVFPLSILISIGFFLTSLIFLLVILRFRLPKMYKKFKEENPEKRPIKEVFKELFGFD